MSDWSLGQWKFPSYLVGPECHLESPEERPRYTCSRYCPARKFQWLARRARPILDDHILGGPSNIPISHQEPRSIFHLQISIKKHDCKLLKYSNRSNQNFHKVILHIAMTSYRISLQQHFETCPRSMRQGPSLSRLNSELLDSYCPIWSSKNHHQFPCCQLNKKKSQYYIVYPEFHRN